MKRILTIQDISCLGKCSLTVALPIISACGVEAVILPTAVLSTHTQFSGFTFRDLTEDMVPIGEHWKKEGFAFDAIYTGYLGSEEQIQIVSDLFDTFRNEKTKIIMDPAMADNGKLYAGFTPEFAKKMGSLCAKADIILPNISEAALMLGEPYPGEDADEGTVKELLLKLSGLGAGCSIITGTNQPDATFGYTGYEAATKTYFSYGTKKVPYRSHGTGDIFASAFTGALMRDKSTEDALKIASLYTAASIKNTFEEPDHINYGVNFEAEIPYLLELLKS